MALAEANSLCRALSNSKRPGPVRTLRPRLPRVPAAGRVNARGLKYWLGEALGTRSGRWPRSSKPPRLARSKPTSGLNRVSRLRLKKPRPFPAAQRQRVGIIQAEGVMHVVIGAGAVGAIVEDVRHFVGAQEILKEDVGRLVDGLAEGVIGLHAEPVREPLAKSRSEGVVGQVELGAEHADLPEGGVYARGGAGELQLSAGQYDRLGCIDISTWPARCLPPLPMYPASRLASSPA